MITIYKYIIPPKDHFILQIPTDPMVLPRFLSVQMQRGEACMWVMVDTESPKEAHKFVVIGTGQKVPFDVESGKYDYIGTFLPNPNLVFHVFEVFE